MKFTICNIDNLTKNLEKIERLFAYKYEVSKEAIALIIKGKNIHVLVDGKCIESFRPEQLLTNGIDENTLMIKTIKPEYKPFKNCIK